MSFLKSFKRNFQTFVFILASLILSLQLLYESIFSHDTSLSFPLILPSLFFFIYPSFRKLVIPTLIYLISHIIRMIVQSLPGSE
jgi:hypothetical protein